MVHVSIMYLYIVKESFPTQLQLTKMYIRALNPSITRPMDYLHIWIQYL